MELEPEETLKLFLPFSLPFTNGKLKTMQAHGLCFPVKA